MFVWCHDFILSYLLRLSIHLFVHIKYPAVRLSIVLPGLTTRFFHDLPSHTQNAVLACRRHLPPRVRRGRSPVEPACCEDRQDQGGCPSQLQLHMDRIRMECRLCPGRLLLWYVSGPRLQLLNSGHDLTLRSRLQHQCSGLLGVGPCVQRLLLGLRRGRPLRRL